MKKEAKQHLIYSAILLVVVTGILLYQNEKINETQQFLLEQLADLKQQTEQQHIQTTNSLHALQDNITKVDTSLKVNQESVRSLSTEVLDFKTSNEQNVAALEQSITNLKVQYQDFSAVIEDVVPSVVSVQTNLGSGSGFIIDARGHIITNYHVMEGARAADIITHDGKTHRVAISGYNRVADIAVLRINDTSYQPLRFGNSNNAKVGEKVIAIGNPGGLDFSVTQGIISATNRQDSNGNQYIQIDVPINPGNSGGPLINAEGNVLGVNTLKLVGFESLGFALSSSYVDNIVTAIIEE